MVVRPCVGAWAIEGADRRFVPNPRVNRIIEAIAVVLTFEEKGTDARTSVLKDHGIASYYCRCNPRVFVASL
jgi:hypothetical protein